MCRWNPKKHSSYPYLVRLLVSILLFSFWTAACTPGLPVISVPSEPQPSPSETARETETSPTTPTPSPTIQPHPGRVLLLAPTEGNQLPLEEVQAVLEGLVSQAGYSLEIIQSLTPEEITPDVRLVVSLPPDPGLESLAASARETRFFALGIPGLDESPNLTSASIQQDGMGLQGFMGGVIAALVTPDWRIGMISIADAPQGALAREGFINGAVYFCGTCRQIYPPFFDSQNQLIQYPLYVEIPSAASETEWQSAADYLIERGVETIYIFPGAGGVGLLNYLVESGINIIGGEAPPDGIQKNWVASIYSDPSGSWQTLLERAILDQETPAVSGGLQIGYINIELLTPGRQKLAEAVLEDLLNGYIESGRIEEQQVEP